jgi:hypothetical protein
MDSPALGDQATWDLATWDQEAWDPEVWDQAAEWGHGIVDQADQDRADQDQESAQDLVAIPDGDHGVGVEPDRCRHLLDSPIKVPMELAPTMYWALDKTSITNKRRRYKIPATLTSTLPIAIRKATMRNFDERDARDRVRIRSAEPAGF